MAKHMNVEEGQGHRESIQRARKEQDMRKVDASARALAQKFREQPYDETTTSARNEVQQHGNHEVEKVFRCVAKSPRMQGYAKHASVTTENGQVIKVLELVNDGKDLAFRESSEADSVERFIELNASVKWLYEFKYTLLHAVETYKLLLACHLLLLLAMIAVLVAMTRA